MRLSTFSALPVVGCLILALSAVDSLSLPRTSAQRQETGVRHQDIKPYQNDETESYRRLFMEQAAALTSAIFLGLPPREALASGGATAGGAYLLSAKQRYNDRVKEGIKGFVAAGQALEKGSTDEFRSFFSSDDSGAWKDFSTAGYLLANAFRRNSTAAPDSLPAVKKWKAFASQVEAMTKALKKKDTAGGVAAYKASLDALDEYLGQVELPDGKEIVGS